MSGNSDPDAKAASPATPITQLWADWFAQSNDQARVLMDAVRSLCDPEQIQRRWLDAVVQSVDGFMRSPAFLEAIRRNLKMMTDLKGLQDQFTQGFARLVGIPAAADITGLFERLNSAEQEILARLRVIETRQKSIDAKLS